MRKALFTEHKIIAALKSVEAGRTVKLVCREAGISESSYYNWKAKFGGMEPSDIKNMFADLSLECRALKTLLKKALKPVIKRELVSYLTAQFAMSLRQAGRTLPLSRTVFRYQPDTQRDEPVIMAQTVAAERYPRYRFKKLFQVLRRQSNSWNHKRVHRICSLLKLNFRVCDKAFILTAHHQPGQVIAITLHPAVKACPLCEAVERTTTRIAALPGESLRLREG